MAVRVRNWGIQYYKEIAQGSSFLLMKQFGILIVVVVTLIYTRGKIAQNYPPHTHL